MIRPGLCGFVLLASTLLAFAQESSPLEKLDPAKLPPAVRPPKGTPPEVLGRLGQKGDKVDCFAFRPDGKFFAVSGPDQFLRIWSTDGLKLVSSTKQADSVVCLAFSPDSKLLAVGDASGNVRIWDKSDKLAMLKTLLPAHKDGPVWTLAFDPDGKRLATGGRDKALKLWDVGKAKATLLASQTGLGDEVRSLAFTPDGKGLLSMCPEEKQVRVWDVSGDKFKAGESAKLSAVALTVAVAPDGSSVITAGAKSISAIRSFKDGKLGDSTDLETDKRPVLSASYAPDGSLLVGTVIHSPTEERVLVWDKDGKKKHEFKYDSHLLAAGFASDSRHMIVITETATLLVRLPK